MVDISPEPSPLRARWEQEPGQVLLAMLSLVLTAGMYVVLYGEQLRWLATTWPYNAAAGLALATALAAVVESGRRQRAARRRQKERDRHRRRAIHALAPVVVGQYKRLAAALEQAGVSPPDLEAVPAHVSRIRQHLRTSGHEGNAAWPSEADRRWLLALAAAEAIEAYREAERIVLDVAARYESAFSAEDRQRLASFALSLRAMANAGGDVNSGDVAEPQWSTSLHVYLAAVDALGDSVMSMLYLCAPD